MTNKRKHISIDDNRHNVGINAYRMARWRIALTRLAHRIMAARSIVAYRAWRLQAWHQRIGKHQAVGSSLQRNKVAAQWRVASFGDAEATTSYQYARFARNDISSGEKKTFLPALYIVLACVILLFGGPILRQHIVR